MIEEVKKEIEKLLGDDKSGHDFEHIMRVYHLALKICETEKADKEIVQLAVLLHDVDDYKIFGKESAENLTNTKRILADCGVSAEVGDKVCEIIKTMGYSNCIDGIRPSSLEGQIVSDADMLDSLGANGIIRWAATSTLWGKKIFDRNLFPKVNMSKETYQTKYGSGNSSIPFFFDRAFKLKNLMFTKKARELAEKKHEFVKNFLIEFFEEENAPEWIEYLNEYEKNNK